ncbi:TrkH family potassium uptake protein [Alloyangia pacifica]|uniref:TrkH family potassium uptake protein n=1 Tax=Alloyangia pacifica TaxID=311180 RepID=UPI001CD3A384|nr:TrkH family potassium uptake protein [Alloyangia pacifica]MCA0997899.1 TrkH family potassium uptake protein [Alloyangia pacifica]
MSFIYFINGLVCVFFAALMGVVAILFPETAGVFGISAALVGMVGVGVSLSTWSEFLDLNRLHTFLLTSSVWVTAAVAGAVPLWQWGLSPVDAVFEAMSGITTTGSTVMSGLDDTPHGIILWRALLQAVGGVGFIVTGIAMLPMLQVGGMQLFRTESSDKGEKELRSAASFASATLGIYLALMAVCGFLYLVGGMGPFDALTHAMTTLSTGGYSGYDASFGHFTSPFLQWTGTIFMLLGALPFAWYVRVVHRGALRSEQVEGLIKGLVVVIAVLSLWLVIAKGWGPFEAATAVAFNVVSVVTTTGYATTDYTLWGPFAAVAFFLLTAAGGCTGSTSGGAKAMRWLLFVRALRAKMQMIRAPHAVVAIRYEGMRVDEDTMRSVIVFMMFYGLTFGGFTIVLDFFGLDFSTSASAALTALANVGPGVGPIIGPAGNFATLSDPVKLILAFAMYLGRLEMITVYVLLTPLFWREVGALRRG